VKPLTARVRVACLAAAAACGRGGNLDTPDEAAPATIAVADGDAQQGVVGAPLAGPLVVRVSDESGHPAQDARVSFHATAGGGTVDPAEMITDANGRASTMGRLGTTAGGWEARAVVTTRDGALLEAIFHAVAAPAGPDVLVVAEGDGQTAEAGRILDDSLAVRVLDRFGNPVPGVLLAWQPQEDGSVSPVETATGAAGIAKAERRLGPGAGIQHTVVSIAGADKPSLTFTHTARKGAPAALLYVSGDGQSGVIGQELGAPVVVKVNDRSGNPLEAIEVSWSVASGGGTVAPATVSTSADGTASAAWTIGDLLGRQTLTASVPGLATLIFEATALDGGT